LKTKSLLAEIRKMAIISLIKPNHFLILGIFANSDGTQCNTGLRKRAMVA
jgi:hypothetical protein